MRTLIVAAALGAFWSQPALADPVLGEWLAGGGSAKVKIAPCAGAPDRMCGLISWLKTPRSPTGEPARDTANPDPKLRGRPILGMPMIRDFKRAGEGRWTGGKIYDPNSGRTYDSKIRMNPDGTLKVEGCVLMVCQAQTWRRG